MVRGKTITCNSEEVEEKNHSNYPVKEIEALKQYRDIKKNHLTEKNKERPPSPLKNTKKQNKKKKKNMPLPMVVSFCILYMPY